ncbi:MAG TPA: nitroreductase family protein [Methanocorpusculum sp.]|nr:nitroreductase family protein [Methanocorpusculum sp.]
MNSSDFSNFLSTRVSTRKYNSSSDPISDSDLEYIINSASKAPTAGNLESWDVVCVTDPSILELLMDAADSQPQIKESGCVLCVCANYIRAMSRYKERGILFAIEDATIVSTYMILAAHALRLQSCWVGQFDDDEVKNILGLPPHIRPISLLCIGHGEPTFTSQPTRMDIENHIHYDSW